MPKDCLNYAESIKALVPSALAEIVSRLRQQNEKLEWT